MLLVLPDDEILGGIQKLITKWLQFSNDEFYDSQEYYMRFKKSDSSDDSGTGFGSDADDVSIVDNWLIN